MSDRSHGRLVGSAFLVTASTYFTYALGLVVGALVARTLGPAEYGHYAYMVWLSGWLVIGANHGITNSAIRFVAEFRGKGSESAAGGLHTHLLKWQWGTLALIAAGFIALSLAFPDASWSVGGIAIVLATVLCVISRTMYLFDISVAKGYGAYHVEAYSTILVGLVSALGAVVLWLIHAGLGQFVALFTATSVLMSVMAVVQLKRAGIRAGRALLPAEELRVIRTHTLWTALLVIVGIFGKRSIETFMLNAYWDSKQVGYFTLAGGLARGSTELLTVGLSTVLMPTMGHAFGVGGKERVHDIFRAALRYFVFLGILLAGVSSFLAPPAVLLLYGPDYTPVSLSLQVMQITGGLTLSEAAIGALLSTTGHQSIWAKVTLLPVAISAVLAVLLVPHYGIPGALLSSTISRAIGFTVLVIITVRSQSIRLPWKALGGLIASGLTATVVAELSQIVVPGVLGQFLAAALFTGLFLFLCFPLGAWQSRDARLVGGLIQRLPWLEKVLRPIERRMQRMP